MTTEPAPPKRRRTSGRADATPPSGTAPTVLPTTHTTTGQPIVPATPPPGEVPADPDPPADPEPAPLDDPGDYLPADPPAPDPNAPNPAVTFEPLPAPAHLDPRIRWRVTYLYSDQAPPPIPGGSVAGQTLHRSETGRDDRIADVRANLEHLGRVLIEERMFDDVTGRPHVPELWRVVRTFTRDDTLPTGWETR
jgi:hypothetical protein